MTKTKSNYHSKFRSQRKNNVKELQSFEKGSKWFVASLYYPFNQKITVQPKDEYNSTRKKNPMENNRCEQKKTHNQHIIPIWPCTEPSIHTNTHTTAQI